MVATVKFFEVMTSTLHIGLRNTLTNTSLTLTVGVVKNDTLRQKR
jgi:hypothetical protein